MGADSPVRADSSTLRTSPAVRTPSAGRRSPSPTRTMSPGTSSRAATERSTLSRITRARGCDRSRSAAKAFSLRASCRTTRPMVARAPAIRNRPSPRSPSTRYSAEAPMSSRNIGSRMVSKIIRNRPRLADAGSALGPTDARRRSASALLSPSRASESMGQVRCLCGDASRARPWPVVGGWDPRHRRNRSAAAGRDDRRSWSSHFLCPSRDQP
jgi:hypothetical protein